jgi:hypothetical protein
LVDVRTVARHADGRLGGLWNRHVLKRINTACVSGGFIQNLTEINQTKQIGKYIFMEKVFHQQGSNLHPLGMCHCCIWYCSNKQQHGEASNLPHLLMEVMLEAI